MKSSYELAMERLNQKTPESSFKLTDKQKKKITEIDSLYRSKIAEKEVLLRPKIEQARAQGADASDIRVAEEELRREVKAIQDKMEHEKEKIRGGG